MGRLKEKVALSCASWLAMWVLVGGADPALAQEPAPHLLVLDAPGTSQHGLAAALRIQLIDGLEVQEREWSPSGSVAERIERAAELGRAASALAVVWNEPALTRPDGSREAVLYMVGQRDGRALLEVVRVPGSRGPELDRTLALKVSELLREIQTSDVSRALRAVAADSGTVTNQLSWGGFSLAGARLASSLGPGELRLGLGAALGPELKFAPWSIRLALGLDLFPSLTIDRQGSEVQVSELAPLAGLALLWIGADITLALRASAALSILSARGRSALGNHGESTQRSIAGSVGIGIERALIGRLAIAASLDLQVHALRHRFQINRETVADLGRAQFVFGLDLVFRAP